MRSFAHTSTRPRARLDQISNKHPFPTEDAKHEIAHATMAVSEHKSILAKCGSSRRSGKPVSTLELVILLSVL
jgi:hypothetical protein